MIRLDICDDHSHKNLSKWGSVYVYDIAFFIQLIGQAITISIKNSRDKTKNLKRI